MKNYSVCIIGAGPAGLTLACFLSAAGMKTIVIEKETKEKWLERGRAGLLDADALEILDKLGLKEKILVEGAPHGKCEFRLPNLQIIVDYGAMVGKKHMVYPQQVLTNDLADLYESRGGEILYDTPVTEVYGGASPYVICTSENENKIIINADFIAGCDGFYSVVRSAMPADVVSIYEENYPWSWLAILAEVPPSSPHIIYGLHPNGFAGHMLRKDDVSRFYIQIPLEDTIESWAINKIWDALDERLYSPGWKLRCGDIIELQRVRMRNVVVEPMCHANLFLAGDSAHIVTPAGAKGMNLAILDAADLAHSLIEFYAGREYLLESYSSRRLEVAWKVIAFSASFLELLNPLQHNAYQKRLNKTRIEQLRGNSITAQAFAQNYVGTPYVV